jgi:Domain of unknown function (DUF6916)
MANMRGARPETKKSVEHLTVDAFQPRIGERFRIRPFALSVRTNQKGALARRIYEVEHDEMGAYDIFLVPTGPDTIGMLYEATLC